MAKKAPPETFTLAPEMAARLLGWLAAGFAATLALLMLLPNDPYYRWQQGDGTILFRARWIYERIHFDSTPIDVAMIGSSRMEASVRAGELGAILSQRLGRPIRVVNLALPQEGRDLHWTVAREVLAARPELRLIVLSGGRESVTSHPGFRFLGDDRSVAGAPIMYNPAYMQNLLTLPYRHLAYFLQGLWPGAFALSPRFDAAVYRARSFDPAQSFVMPDGTRTDRDKQVDMATIQAQRAAVASVQADDPKLRHLPLDARYATERGFVRRIAALAAEKRVSVAFLRVPVYDAQPERFVDPGFYRRIGPVLEATQLGADPRDYMDAGHLNRRGTARLLPWLADRLTPILARAERR